MYITFHTPHAQGDSGTPVFHTTYITFHTPHAQGDTGTPVFHTLHHLSHTSGIGRRQSTRISHVTFHTPHTQGDADTPVFHTSPFTHLTHTEMPVHLYFTQHINHLSHTSRTMRRRYTRISHNIYFKTLLTCGFRHGLDLSLIIKQSHPLQAKLEQKSIQYRYEKELIQLPLNICMYLNYVLIM